MSSDQESVYTLISATPSPYARKVRIVLQEKGIPFTLQTEVPWNSDTETPKYNPLEKLPVLINNKSGNAVYESHFILEWLEAKHPNAPMLPKDVDQALFAKQIEVVADGICDALVLALWEGRRGEDKQSKPWADRQTRKVEGGLRQLNEWVEQGQGRFIIGDSLTLADVAVCSLLGFMLVRFPDHKWQLDYPKLKQYQAALDERVTFANTRPKPQVFRDAVV
ncbi:hypothetical protein AC579_8718 [Pseudocercospora musae]|uniref:GST N-terminal domain-containing protein n=1 Tax=Pseudocercospora musae TaxID=113226 RepID=A0A139IWN3_9PEZI|nr:hypothetical protein AC579_8718 [Pseudocercospora musae]